MADFRRLRARYRNLLVLGALLGVGAQPSSFIMVTESSRTEIVHETGNRRFDSDVEQFTRAVLALRAGHADSALVRFERVAASSDALRAWSQYLAAESAALLGDTTRVREHLAQTRPDLQHSFGWRARTLGLERAGDFFAGARLADSVAGSIKSSRARALAFARAGRMRLQLHDTTAARKALVAAVEASTGSDAAQDAASHLADLKALRASELRALARVARAHGQAGKALSYYRQARKKMAPGEERARLVLEMGRYLFASREYDTLRSELKTLAKGNGALAGEALLLIGRAELRSRNTRAGLAALRRSLASKASVGTRLTAAFLLADIAQDAGNMAQADTYFRRVIALSPRSGSAAEAYMRRGGAAFARGDFEKAAEIFAAYASRQAKTGRAHQAKYWLARSLAKTGKATESKKLLNEIVVAQPYSYYAMLARRSTGDTAAVPAPGPGPESSPEAIRLAKTSARVVRLLREVELDEQASYESARAIDSVQALPGGLHAYAEAVQELGGTAAGIAVGQQVLSEGKWDERLLRIVYPFPYRGVITREARRNDLAPDFVAAFIRQESMFEPRARSGAGALGLMQLMPQTARSINKRVDAEDLFDPNLNVRIGTAHLRDLLQEYGGHTERLIAAYNAGGTPVAQWLKFPESKDPELFVERIPYDETRDYVRIVQRNAWLYSWLYGTE